jgi:hypothetical protein
MSIGGTEHANRKHVSAIHTKWMCNVQFLRNFDVKWQLGKTGLYGVPFRVTTFRRRFCGTPSVTNPPA